MTRNFPLRTPQEFIEAVAYAAVYGLLGSASLPTAIVQSNTAAVWIPSGFAIGLLLVKGRRYWPSVMLGSFAFNAILNLSAPGSDNAALSLITALLVALGNTGEALIGVYLTERFASGLAFFMRARNVIRFLLLTVPLPPILSTLIGVGASRLGDVPIFGSLGDVTLTWYIANAEGILLYTGITVLLLSIRREQLSLDRFPIERLPEATVLFFIMALGILAICGFYITDWLRDWPKAYMLIPLVIWATFRFGTLGGLLSVAFITFGASLSTLLGHMAFPADNPATSLLYLQVYLAMLAVMTLVISASLTEAISSRQELEYQVGMRTRSVEQLLKQRDVLTALVAHDLKSPIYGVRNTLRAARSSITEHQISNEDLIEAMTIMEQTCNALADRVSALLKTPLRVHSDQPGSRKSLSEILEASRTAHLTSLRARNITLSLETPGPIVLEHGPEAEHLIDTLIDNAIRHSPESGTIRVVASLIDDKIEVSVIDQGPGIDHKDHDRIFEIRGPDHRSAASSRAHRSGLGLHLARMLAEWINAKISYRLAPTGGAMFSVLMVGHLERTDHTLH